MAKPRFKIGDLIVAQGRKGAFKITDINGDGATAHIQAFSVLKRQVIGPVIRYVPCSTLLPFKEDAHK